MVQVASHYNSCYLPLIIICNNWHLLFPTDLKSVGAYWNNWQPCFINIDNQIMWNRVSLNGGFNALQKAILYFLRVAGYLLCCLGCLSFTSLWRVAKDFAQCLVKDSGPPLTFKALGCVAFRIPIAAPRIIFRETHPPSLRMAMTCCNTRLSSSSPISRGRPRLALHTNMKYV